MSEALLRIAIFMLSIAAVIAAAKLIVVAWEWTP